MKPHVQDRITLAAFLILIGIIVFLCVQLSQAWANERYLDDFLRQHTTYTQTNYPMQK